MIGGTAGSFLGEYQAGGVIVVLGLGARGKSIVGNFPCTGMHGGKMYLRSDCVGVRFPPQVTARQVDAAETEELQKILLDYCAVFGYGIDMILRSPFTVVTPNTANPYQQMYVAN